MICRHAHIVHENSNSDLNLKHMCRRRLRIYSVTQQNEELINLCNVKQGQHTELPRNREKTDIRYRKTINDYSVGISAILVVLSCRCSIRSGLFLLKIQHCSLFSSQNIIILLVLVFCSNGFGRVATLFHRFILNLTVLMLIVRLPLVVLFCALFSSSMPVL